MSALNKQSSSGTRNGLENRKENRKAKILKRRGTFLWLPVLCSNDIVHGSWWFVWGSFLSMLIPILILVNPYIHIYETAESTLPALSYYATWILLSISGFLFTLGSFFFVRAFEEPSITPCLKNWTHFQTDELIAAWLFFFGTVPFVPYCIFWWWNRPGEILYIGAVIASLFFLFCMYLFVLACYPSDKKHKQVIKPIARFLFGYNHWLIKHIQNDWLAGCWIFYISTLVCLLGCFVLLCKVAYENNEEEMFIYGFSVLDFFIYLVGCAYFCSGSYPEDQEKCYKIRSKSAHNSSDGNKLQQEEEEEEDDRDGPPTAARRRLENRDSEADDDNESVDSVNNVIFGCIYTNEEKPLQPQKHENESQTKEHQLSQGPPVERSQSKHTLPLSTAVIV